MAKSTNTRHQDGQRYVDRYKVATKAITSVPGGCFRRSRRAFKLLTRFLVAAMLGLAIFADVFSICYGIPFREAASGVARQSLLFAIQAGVSLFDPCRPKLAELGPADAKVDTPPYPRLEKVLSPGSFLVAKDGQHVRALAINNATIVRSPYRFSYQPYDDPRLQQIREQYRLDQVVAAATSEFEAMIRVRGWARSLFRREESFDEMTNFNAIEVLSRRKEGSPENPSVENYDPCHLFPLLYAQLMASLGYETRIVSVGHAVVEIWSNQYQKWVLMDTEFDHHFEKGGIPLSVADVLEANLSGDTGIRLVRGTSYPMLENPTMVHLKVAELRAEDCLPWFKNALELTDLRNDWLTNHYFPGHPKRSEANSLVYIDPHLKIDGSVAFRNYFRPQTHEKSDIYWTLNQVEIRFRSWNDREIELVFETVTPNFQHFEVVLDGKTSRRETSAFRWKVHEGRNSLAVRPVNRFGVRGIESSVLLKVFPEDSTQPSCEKDLQDGNVRDAKSSPRQIRAAAP